MIKVVSALLFLLSLSFAPIAIAQKKASTPKIEILVASWCVHCRVLETFLQEQNIGYTKLDIGKDPDGRKKYLQLGGGGVPMVIIGNSVLKGFDKEAILEMLETSARTALSPLI